MVLQVGKSILVGVQQHMDCLLQINDKDQHEEEKRILTTNSQENYMENSKNWQEYLQN